MNIADPLDHFSEPGPPLDSYLWHSNVQNICVCPYFGLFRACFLGCMDAKMSFFVFLIVTPKGAHFSKTGRFWAIWGIGALSRGPDRKKRGVLLGQSGPKRQIAC